MIKINALFNMAKNDITSIKLHTEIMVAKWSQKIIKSYGISGMKGIIILCID